MMVSHRKHIDKTSQDLINFQHFLCYDKINPISNHQLCFFVTAKTIGVGVTWSVGLLVILGDNHCKFKSKCL